MCVGLLGPILVLPPYLMKSPWVEVQSLTYGSVYSLACGHLLALIEMLCPDGVLPDSW